MAIASALEAVRQVESFAGACQANVEDPELGLEGFIVRVAVAAAKCSIVRQIPTPPALGETRPAIRDPCRRGWNSGVRPPEQRLLGKCRRRRRSHPAKTSTLATVPRATSWTWPMP